MMLYAAPPGRTENHLLYGLPLAADRKECPAPLATADLPTNIMDFRGFYSSIILILRAGIPRPTGDFPESLSQAMLVGVMLVGRLSVRQAATVKHPRPAPLNLRTKLVHF